MLRIPIVAFLFFFTCSAAAQVGSARIWLSLYFEGAHGIQVTDANIGLSLNTPTDFAQGVTTGKLTGHLQVTSRGSYEVWIKTQQPAFSVNGSITDIPVNAVMVHAQNGYTSHSVHLSAEQQLLINNPNKIAAETIDVTYSIPPNQTYKFFNRNETSFQTMVTYTLILN